MQSILVGFIIEENGQKRSYLEYKMLKHVNGTSFIFNISKKPPHKSFAPL